ncbi:MAG TPA: CoA transferase [Syntrophorhabdaceae bacterium]|nr:CoA transferase [Syntrophorhabdaceae bacterium]
MTDSLLNGLRALDLTDEKGAICGKILATFGVEVIKIEPPGGDPERRMPPLFNREGATQLGLAWLASNTDKQSIILDITTKEDQERFLELVAVSDFVLESYTPGYLDTLGLGYKALRRVNPRVILTSITPFGQAGPYAHYKGGELIASAMSGVMVTNGDPGRPPLKEGPDSIRFESSAAAVAGTIIAHYHREQSGEGQQVDVSLQEVPAKRTSTNLAVWEFDRRLIPRNGTARTFGVHSTQWIWACKDGYVFWNFLGGRFNADANRALSRWIDEDGMENPLNRIADWETFDMAAVSKEDIEAQQSAIARFFLRRTKKEIADEGLKRGINACVVHNPADVLQVVQLQARGYWTTLKEPDVESSLVYPRHYFLSSETENFVRRAAPITGEHTEKIMASLAGARNRKSQANRPGVEKPPAHSADNGKQALAGINVLDFGWALVGSLTGKYLADHGAQVIRVESLNRPDFTRANRLTSGSSATNPDDKPWFTHYNTSKLSLSLDLKHPRARDIVEGLVRWADVLNENFTPGTIGKLGFGYDRIRQIKPDIIMLSASAYGQTGPMAQEWGIDGTGSSLSGYLDLTGWPDKSPVGPNPPYSDTVVPFFTVSAIVAALDYRRRTGKGQYIDANMLEVSVHQITPELLDFQANGHLRSRSGNRIAHASPHGVFPCKGDDRWCAVAVFTDEEWQALYGVLGNPAWAVGRKFATLEARKTNEDELEAHIGEWTKERTAEDVMKMLQAVGVAAGVVQTAEDVMEHDPQLNEREFLLPLKHPVIGVFGHPTPPFKLLGTKAQITTSPCMGEHNEFICRKLLGMSDEEFIELEQAKLFI